MGNYRSIPRIMILRETVYIDHTGNTISPFQDGRTIIIWEGEAPAELFRLMHNEMTMEDCDRCSGIGTPVPQRWRACISVEYERSCFMMEVSYINAEWVRTKSSALPDRFTGG